MIWGRLGFRPRLAHPWASNPGVRERRSSQGRFFSPRKCVFWLQSPILASNLGVGPHFLGKSVEILVLSSIFWPPGTLQRIQQIHRIQRKRATASRMDPGFPTPGSRMTVVYTNSLKQESHFALPFSEIEMNGPVPVAWSNLEVGLVHPL